ncbi:hypothetical protein WOLCODRAFT_110374 [Wolfiporia cocos MD-104 SS10]|uniref:Sucraseferredoxin-like protein n=1 Tax=Wolfiporia cocos (strain MD-104) TaxID=742152 RepID=A0A2H3JSF8_WOLCO|nr:hypothetical protein WOLCODRAFT_110374 [Wolfiporia cocos MD-104 SS10]
MNTRPPTSVLSALTHAHHCTRPTHHWHLSRNVRAFTCTAPAAQLAGTVPHHSSYIVLHTHPPPASYPAKPRSPLLRALMLRARAWGGIANFAWAETQCVHPGYAGIGEGDAWEREAYCATAFAPDGRVLEVPEVTMENLEEVGERLREHTLGGNASEASSTNEHKIHLYVCTHGARDCRCGETGGEVEAALRQEVAKRGIKDKVMVGSVAHIGGHKYAGNLLVFPSGDWLGTIQAIDVPNVLNEILERHETNKLSQDYPAPLCGPFWRGRMGLDKDQQLSLYSSTDSTRFNTISCISLQPQGASGRAQSSDNNIAVR